jgi:CIC family chloride channel protein
MKSQIGSVPPDGIRTGDRRHLARLRPPLRAAHVRVVFEGTRDVVLVALVTGALTGLGVLAFDRLTASAIFDHLAEAPAWLQVGAPLTGLALAAASLRWLAGGASPSTSDEYIKAMPVRDAPFDLRPAIGRIVASVCTLGFGGAMGYEGPSIYLGTAVGAGLDSRMRRFTGRIDRRVLLVAGAAAGVAAIFKAPATGAVFAVEVPFQDDLARHSLLPAMIGAASGYTVFVIGNGTAPLFPVSGSPAIDFRDLAVAVLIGLACGAGARLFAWLLGRAKQFATGRPRWVPPAAAGVVLGAFVVVSRVLFSGRALSLGAGYGAISWALDPKRGLWLIVALASVRAAATVVTVGGAGAGGLFVPLVVQGALTGRLIGAIPGVSDSLCVVLGIAAFLGAGYRVPLAAVMFVAETTGRPGFIVPGLIAAVIAQLVMGEASVSATSSGGGSGTSSSAPRCRCST